jgi:hypothetical protein
MLLAYASPQNIIVSKGLPLLADLGGTTEGSGIEVSENLE